MTYWIAWHFSLFVRFLIIVLHNTTLNKRAAFTLVLRGSKHVLLSVGTVLLRFAFVKMLENTKIEKATACPFVLWGLKIRVLSTGTGHLNLSGRRQADAARGQRGELA